jgi:hypothetical protein
MCIIEGFMTQSYLLPFLSADSGLISEFVPFISLFQAFVDVYLVVKITSSYEGPIITTGHPILPQRQKKRNYQVATADM